MIRHSLEEGEVEEFAPLVVFGLVPLDYGVFQLTDPVQIAVNFL